MGHGLFDDASLTFILFAVVQWPMLLFAPWIWLTSIQRVRRRMAVASMLVLAAPFAIAALELVFRATCAYFSFKNGMADCLLSQTYLYNPASQILFFAPVATFAYALLRSAFDELVAAYEEPATEDQVRAGR